jgi:hypothetical protein
MAVLELGSLCVACNHGARLGRLWTENFADESEFRFLLNAEGLESRGMYITAEIHRPSVNMMLPTFKLKQETFVGKLAVEIKLYIYMLSFEHNNVYYSINDRPPIPRNSEVLTN